MKKLTLVLVALLLALTCVFVACGKKNETPVDNTDPKPVDNTPAPVETPTVEDMTPVAEQFKKDYAANYVDLYSKEVENAIDAEKSAALLKIMGATTKEEAQKIADEFIAFLKAQKNSYDVLKGLVAEIGDVALADEDLIKEAAAYKAALDAAFAGTNAAKKAVLDAYKADEETQKAVKDLAARLAVLKNAKIDANVKKGEKDSTDTVAAKDGINLEIADLNKKFNEADKKFSLTDFDDYALKVKAVEAFAKAYKLEAGTDAYEEIIDTKTLAAAKAILDDVAAKDKVLVAMLKVVDAAAALEAKAEEARYVETMKVDKNKLGAYDADDRPIAVKNPANPTVRTFAPAKVADGTDEDNIIEVEIDIGKEYFNEATVVEYYKLALKADVEAAQEVSKDLFKFYNETELAARYDYGKTITEPVKCAVESIKALADAYETSVQNAKADYPTLFTTQYVDVVPKKDATIGTYTLTTALKAKATDNQTALAEEIANLIASFKTNNAAGKPITPYVAGYKDQGAYTPDGTNHFDLVDGKPTIYFEAWTYSYEIDGKPLAATKFVASDDLTATTLKDAKDAIKWLEIYIGEGNYAEKYDFTEYKKYDGGFDGVVLYLTDRAVEEVAKAGVVQIDGKAIEVAKSAEVAAKVLSPLDVANALIAEDKKIADAKKEAVEELKAAVAALIKEGDANAITAARELYKDITSGAYLNKKLYEGKISDKIVAPATTSRQNDLLGKDISAETVELRAESAKGKGDQVVLNINALLTKAEAILTAADALDFTSTQVKVGAKTQTLEKFVKDVTDAEKAVADNDEYIEVFAEYVAEAKKILETAKAGEEAKVVIEKTDANNAYVVKAQANYNNALQLAGIFTDVDTFKANYKDNPEGKGANTGYLSDKTKAKIKTFLENFEPDEADYDADDMADKIAKLYAGTANDGETLAKVVEADKKDLAAAIKAYDELKLMTPAKAYDDDTDIQAVIDAIDAFIDFTKDGTSAPKAAADYINLKVSATYDTKTVAFDLLSDVYTAKLLSKAYAPVGKILKHAAKLDTDNSLTTVAKAIKGEAWEDSVTNLVNAEDAAIGTVASVKAAEKALEDYKLNKDNYKLDSALTLINKALTDASKSPITLGDLKTVAGIE